MAILFNNTALDVKGSMENEADKLARLTGEWLNTRVAGMDDGPLRLFNLERFGQNAQALQVVARGLAAEFDCDFSTSYSMKTNPRPDLLEVVRNAGLGIECISLSELAAAQRLGFAADACTLNGPGKWWPSKLLSAVQEPAIVNCDSVQDLARTIDVLKARGWESCTLGVRVSPPGMCSRFGMDLEDAEIAESLQKLLQRVPDERPLGIHIHYAQSAIGAETWVNMVRKASELVARAFGDAVRRLVHFDLGGGWRAGELGSLEMGLRSACGSVRETLGTVRSFQIEPGKHLAEDCGFVVCRVLGRRGVGADSDDLVVTASCAEVPDVASFVHRMLWRKASGGPWRLVEGGPSRVLGRLCMEADVLSRGVSLPPGLDQGDLIAICDTGAYDASMAFSFGTGPVGGLL